MSSPAAAVATLAARTGMAVEGDEEPEFSSYVLESTENRTDDETPTLPVEATEATLADTDRRRLRELARLAEQLRGPDQDSKLRRAIEIVQSLLQEGFHPILWCRYVATAEYVKEHLKQALGPNVQVVCITGRVPDDERQIKIAEIDADRPRVLVATDCLSEGINLQEKFNAAVHYDLPWNPNRLEQREGRVDRFGQPAKRVKVVRFFGRDNPVDGAVIQVLLEKAWLIHQTLGTHVPVPQEGESVLQAVLEALFLRSRRQTSRQLALDLGLPEVEALHRRWDQDVERERINRTRFAQRALKPEEVQRELEATDAVLGDPAAVREFVLAAAQRLGLSVTPDRRLGVFRVAVSKEAIATLPEAIRLALPSARTGYWLVSFESPTPEGAEYLGRNHRFVAALARFLLEDALAGREKLTVSRCGAIRTRAVSALTTLALLRVRYLLQLPERAPLLSEEVLVVGWRGGGNSPLQWLEDDEALCLLAKGKPDANIPLAEKRELVQRALEQVGEWRGTSSEWGRDNAFQKGVRERIDRRAGQLLESHKRIRQAVSMRVRELEVKPQLPPDLLGILVLQPMLQP